MKLYFSEPLVGVRMERKDLPIGVQSFEDLRKNDYLYIDKTKYIEQLLQGKVYFLSRPRRFGKSLFLSTFAAYFRGQKELFKGLYLEKAEEELAQHKKSGGVASISRALPRFGKTGI